MAKGNQSKEIVYMMIRLYAALTPRKNYILLNLLKNLYMFQVIDFKESTSTFFWSNKENKNKI